MSGVGWRPRQIREASLQNSRARGFSANDSFPPTRESPRPLILLRADRASQAVMDGVLASPCAARLIRELHLPTRAGRLSPSRLGMLLMADELAGALQRACRIQWRCAVKESRRRKPFSYANCFTLTLTWFARRIGTRSGAGSGQPRES
jgi:hypothetical protein